MYTYAYAYAYAPAPAPIVIKTTPFLSTSISQELSKLVDGMEEGPLRKMVMSLKNEAVGKLQGVNGKSPIMG